MPRVTRTYRPGEMNAGKAKGLHAESKEMGRRSGGLDVGHHASGVRPASGAMSLSEAAGSRSEAVKKAWKTRKANSGLGAGVSHVHKSRG